MATERVQLEGPFVEAPVHGSVDASQGSVRVIIGTHMRIYGEGLARVLDSSATGIQVVGAVSGIEEIAATIGETLPDVLLLDVAIADRPELMRTLVRRVPVPVVILGIKDREDEILKWIESGITGFVTRGAALGDLTTAIQNAMRGELSVSPRTAFKMLQRLRSGASQLDARLEGVQLTRRELEVMDLVEAGLCNKEIAKRLGVALSTVKNHVHNVLEKLQVTSRYQAVRAVRDRRLMG